MANTYTLINSYAATGTVANIEFSSIPATYTDLVLVLSGRNSGTATGSEYAISFNGSTTSFTSKILYGGGTSAASYSGTNVAGFAENSAQTANTFDNIQIYIPNYAGSTNKSFSVDAVTESNSASSGTYQSLWAGLWSNTAAINTIRMTPPSGSFVIYSTAYLYGVSKS